ncbi:MAG: histidinol-phosphate transaminase, partial [Natronospirillum sp.]
TGIGLPLHEIETLLQQNTESVVIVDEAYIDFGGTSAIALVDRFPNVLVTQTLSKSRALAGLRVGFAVGHPDLIAGLDRVKNSFNSYPVDRMAEAAAVVAMQDRGYFDTSCARVVATRTRTAHRLTALGYRVLPSQANFVFVRPPDGQAAVDVARRLREHKIIVRHFNKPRIHEYLRISIGTDVEMDQFFAVLEG